jgi:hypothetical protein
MCDNVAIHDPRRGHELTRVMLVVRLSLEAGVSPVIWSVHPQVLE